MMQIIPEKPIQKSRINTCVSQLPPSGIRQFFDLVMSKPNVISLGVGEPDFSTPWRICEAGIHSLEGGHTNYTPNNGLPQLREEIAEYLQKHLGCQYDPYQEILVTVGGSEALDLSFRALLEPGDEVVIIDPSFVSYAPLVTLAGGQAVRVPTRMENGFVPSSRQLRDAVSPRTKAVIFNYPNNPTGAGLDCEQADELLEVILENDLVLISDEIYLPLWYEKPTVSFSSFESLRDRLILIHGFSKAWAMTGWRLGFVAGPADFIAGMNKIHQYTIMCSPITAQFAAIEALRHGNEEVESMRKEYDRRRRYITHHLNLLGLTCHPPRGAFYVFPSIRTTGLSSMAFAERLLEEYNVAVVPGSAFGECGEGFIRCSYATSLDELKEAVTQLEAFVTKLSNRNG